MRTDWQWHDRIDANSLPTAVRKGSGLMAVFEGIYDWYGDKLADVDYYAVVEFFDRDDRKMLCSP